MAQPLSRVANECCRGLPLLMFALSSWAVHVFTALLLQRNPPQQRQGRCVDMLTQRGHVCRLPAPCSVVDIMKWSCVIDLSVLRLPPAVEAGALSCPCCRHCCLYSSSMCAHFRCLAGCKSYSKHREDTQQLPSCSKEPGWDCPYWTAFKPCPPAENNTNTHVH